MQICWFTLLCQYFWKDREVLLLALTVALREVAEVERMAAPGCNKPFISD